MVKGTGLSSRTGVSPREGLAGSISDVVVMRLAFRRVWKRHSVAAHRTDSQHATRRIRKRSRGPGRLARLRRTRGVVMPTLGGEDIVRHNLVQRIVEAYGEGEHKPQTKPQTACTKIDNITESAGLPNDAAEASRYNP